MSDSTASTASTARTVLRKRLSLLAVIALLAGLTGCGSGSDSAAPDGSPTATSQSSTASTPSPSPGASDSPPDGDPDSPPASAAVDGRLAGAGYSFTLPEGWRDATAQFKGYSELIDTGAVNAAQTGRAFSDNVNVLRDADQAELPAARAEDQFADELRTVASRVRVQPPTTVDGIEAVHLTGRTEAGEVVALTDQYISFVDGSYYVVTFSYGSRTPQAQRQQEVAAVLDSWTWG